ncbi:hypothetical protein [Arthrobacter sp. ISL-72]|uniref:hypothetical protein n=1 Tax=Arthrobacter sp. ISL-72 TaxID=2819114 RepID=UPI001BE7C8BB|nr:hypothetical protein [Arthrobacter sp. ISL-72]MBT2594980.1 hypothetical protein [Arthrobacter sp. ISL-72]
MASSAASSVARHHQAREDRVVLLYLGHLLAEGYVTIGDVYDGEFLSWNCGVAEALSWVSGTNPFGTWPLRLPQSL